MQRKARITRPRGSHRMGVRREHEAYFPSHKTDFFPLSNHFISQDNTIFCGPVC